MTQISYRKFMSIRSFITLTRCYIGITHILIPINVGQQCVRPRIIFACCDF